MNAGNEGFSLNDPYREEMISAFIFKFRKC